MTVHDMWHGRVATDCAVPGIPIRIRRHAPADPMCRLIDGAGRRWDVPWAGPGDGAIQDWAIQDRAIQDRAIQLKQHDLVRADGRSAPTLATPASRAARTEMPGSLARGVGGPGI